MGGQNSFRAVGVGCVCGGGERPCGNGNVYGSGPGVVSAANAGSFYRHQRLLAGGRLYYGRNDVQAVVSTLRERGGPLFRELGAVTLLDSPASASAIEDRISRHSPASQDVLVVFFAGHGYALKVDGGWEWYLIPFRACGNGERWCRKT